MIPDKWTKETYQKYIEYLKSIKEDKYREFHSKLCQNSKYEILGIRLPILRKIAAKISKTDIDDFISLQTNKYYEEVMILGLVITSIKDEKTFDKYFELFIPLIDNWAICDSFCTSIKTIVKKNPKKYYKIAKKLSLSKKEFTSRVGLIIIFDNFKEKEYLNETIDLLNKITLDKYYTNMAEAWLICELYIYYPQEIIEFLKDNKLNKFTQNKAISKIRDSYRVEKEEKDFLNTLKK